MTLTLMDSPERTTSVRSVRVSFVHEQQPPDDFIRALREHSPISDEHSWLLPVWEPGDPWAPGQRWVLYEMLHPQFVEDVVLEELRGPHPRSDGHICTSVPTHGWALSAPKHYRPCLCRRKTETWRKGPCVFVTLTQWNLYRETGYYGSPYWVVQGDHGGHKRQFNQHEEDMLKYAELPTEAPAIGELPYAPLDGRVLQHVVRGNRLTAMGVSLTEFRRRMGADFQSHKAQLARDLRAQHVTWLSDQMTDVNELFLSAARKGELSDGNQRRTDIDYERVEEAATAHYVDTGDVLHPSQVR